MTTWYAQQDAQWGSANWNDQADGMGNAGGPPTTGDTAEANAHTVDIVGVDLRGITLATTGGGSFPTSKAYATANGAIATQQWNSQWEGNGKTVALTEVVSYGEVHANNFHLYGTLGDLGYSQPLPFILIETTGSWTFGATPPVWPAEDNVSTVETAWGPTGAEYAGALDLSLYTLTAGMVWPDADNVSTVETAWGPTGAEYAGALIVSAGGASPWVGVRAGGPGPM